MSLHSVIELLADLGDSRDSRRFSKVENRKPTPLADKDFRNFGDSRYSHSLSYTCVDARARTVDIAGKDSPDSRESHSAPSLKVTVLKHCRCQDCRKFHFDGRDFYCDSYIGGTAVVWATGRRFCDPPPDAWHYCSDYHGPQISPDVWVWPRHGSAGVGQGPSSPPAAEYRGGNGTAARFFRSGARAQGMNT